MMAMTQAKTGRSRKNFDSIVRLRYFDFAASKGTTFTEAPGRTFCIPSTITDRRMRGL